MHEARHCGDDEADAQSERHAIDLEYVAVNLGLDQIPHEVERARQRHDPQSTASLVEERALERKDVQQRPDGIVLVEGEQRDETADRDEVESERGDRRSGHRALVEVLAGRES
jgi:hypothetical protein